MRQLSAFSHLFSYLLWFYWYPDVWDLFGKELYIVKVIIIKNRNYKLIKNKFIVPIKIVANIL